MRTLSHGITMDQGCCRVSSRTPISSGSQAFSRLRTGRYFMVCLSPRPRHYYRGSIGVPIDMATLLSPDPRLPLQFPELRSMAAAAHISGGYRVAECNTVTGFVPGVTDAFGAALWTIDFLFANALYHS